MKPRLYLFTDFNSGLLLNFSRSTIYDFELGNWPRQCQDEPASQTSKSYSSKVIDQTHRHTHTWQTALPGPLKWSAVECNCFSFTQTSRQSRSTRITVSQHWARRHIDSAWRWS